jgi:hypothetical protein
MWDSLVEILIGVIFLIAAAYTINVLVDVFRGNSDDRDDDS